MKMLRCGETVEQYNYSHCHRFWFRLEQLQLMERLKRRVLYTIQDLRHQVRKRLNPMAIERMVEQERMATLGAATGAFLGFLL